MVVVGRPGPVGVLRLADVFARTRDGERLIGQIASVACLRDSEDGPAARWWWRGPTDATCPLTEGWRGGLDTEFEAEAAVLSWALFPPVRP